MDGEKIKEAAAASYLITSPLPFSDSPSITYFHAKSHRGSIQFGEAPLLSESLSPYMVVLPPSHARLHARWRCRWSSCHSRQPRNIGTRRRIAHLFSRRAKPARNAVAEADPQAHSRPKIRYRLRSRHHIVIITHTGNQRAVSGQHSHSSLHRPSSLQRVFLAHVEIRF